MKKINAIIAILILINVITIQECYSQNNKSEKDEGKRIEICKINNQYCDEVKKTFLAHNKSYGNKDIKAFMNLLSKEKEVVMIGSNQLDKHIGLEAIEKAVKKDFQAFDTFTTKIPWLFISGNKKTAWLIADVICNIKAKDEEEKIRGRQTVTFSKENGNWRVVNSHFSIPSKINVEQ